MAKKRSKIDEDLFADTTKRGRQKKQEKAGESESTRDRPLKRATYYFTPELKEAIAKRATDLGIPASQLAMFLLVDALDRLDDGDVDPTPYLSPSDSPKFRHNLDFDDWYTLPGDSD